MSEPPRRRGDMRAHRPSRAAHRRQLGRQRLVALAVSVIAVAALALGARAPLTDTDEASSGDSPRRSAQAASDANADGTPTARTETPAAAPASTAGEATAQTAAPSPTSSATWSPAPVIIELGWVGDTTPGSKYGVSPSSSRALFAAVRRQLQAPDLMITSLEGTYSSGGPSKFGATNSSLCYAFQAPPSYAKALPWAGIDLVSVANNHSYDYLARGFSQTTQALGGAGVKYAGSSGKVTVVKVEGVRVGVVAFSAHSWNCGW